MILQRLTNGILLHTHQYLDFWLSRNWTKGSSVINNTDNDTIKSTQIGQFCLHNSLPGKTSRIGRNWNLIWIRLHTRLIDRYGWAAKWTNRRWITKEGLKHHYYSMVSLKLTKNYFRRKEEKGWSYRIDKWCKNMLGTLGRICFVLSLLQT